MQAHSLGAPWRSVLGSGVALALGAGLIDWLDYRHALQPAPAWWSGGLIATLFLTLGCWTGVRLARPPVTDARPSTTAGDDAAAVRHGISPRELEVLHALAQGLTTKEIARALGISPNTVKTHTARLFEKLSATNRTQATMRARDVGILH